MSRTCGEPECAHTHTVDGEHTADLASLRHTPLDIYCSLPQIGRGRYSLSAYKAGTRVYLTAITFPFACALEDSGYPSDGGAMVAFADTVYSFPN